MDFLNVCFAFFSCIFVKVILEEDVKELEDHLNLPEVEYLALVSCFMWMTWGRKWKKPFLQMPGLFFKQRSSDQVTELFFWKKSWDHWQSMDKILHQLRCSEHCKWWELYFINGWRIVSITTVCSCEGWWLAHTSLRGPPSDRNVFHCQMLLFWLVLSFSGCSTLHSNSDQCANLSRRSCFLSNPF